MQATLYEHDRLCLLVPHRGKINLGPHPQNKILIPFRGHFQNIRRAPPSLLYGIPPPPPPRDKRFSLGTAMFVNEKFSFHKGIHWLRSFMSLCTGILQLRDAGRLFKRVSFLVVIWSTPIL